MKDIENLIYWALMMVKVPRVPSTSGLGQILGATQYIQ